MKDFNKGITRRELLKDGVLAGTGLLLHRQLNMSTAIARPKAKASTPAIAMPLLPDPVTTYLPDTQFFTVPLIAALPVATPFIRIARILSYYEISFREGAWRFHPTLPLTPTWGYDDNKGGYIGYLGPTIEARKGEQLIVKWMNELPGNPLDPLGMSDPTIIPPDVAGIWGRANVHVHGGHNPSAFDGGPEHWIAPGSTQITYYPNIQDAASLWYHDHALGVTRTNAYAGLAALYYIRDKWEDHLKLPKGQYEIPLVLQDKGFWWDGGAPGEGTLRLWYPNPWIPEMFGNAMVVNAQLYPVLEVEPRRYRFRLLNASQARFFNLRISSADPALWPVDPVLGYPVPDSLLTMHVVGMELGFLRESVAKSNLVLGNAERADVVVDFKDIAPGTEFVLSNNAMTPFDPTQPPIDPTGLDPNPFTTTPGPALNVMQLMKFRVIEPAPKSRPDTTRHMPAMLRPIKSYNPATATVKRKITLVEGTSALNPAYMAVLIQNRPFNHVPGAGVTETPRLGATEVWQFINMTPDTHPLHIHLVAFQVVDRQKLTGGIDPLTGEFDPELIDYKVAFGGDPDTFTGDIPPQFLNGPPIPPNPEESGFKDTVQVHPGEVTRVVAKFEHFTGPFVYHCHILEHEENDMMQYFVVSATAKEAVEARPTEFVLDQNYPNPFNPETTIRFQVPEDTHVRLTIFDNLGREVENLLDRDLTAGTHLVNWNARNVASGVYHYRLRAGSFVTTKSMMLVK